MFLIILDTDLTAFHNLQQYILKSFDEIVINYLSQKSNQTETAKIEDNKDPLKINSTEIITSKMEHDNVPIRTDDLHEDLMEIDQQVSSTKECTDQSLNIKTYSKQTGKRILDLADRQKSILSTSHSMDSLGDISPPHINVPVYHILTTPNSRLKRNIMTVNGSTHIRNRSLPIPTSLPLKKNLLQNIIILHRYHLL